MGTCHRVFYVSRAAPSVEPTDLADIAAVSSRRNAASGITGRLLFTGEHFAALVEGDRISVATLMRSLRRDARHADLRVIASAPVPERLSDSWTFTYLTADGHCDLIAELMSASRVDIDRQQRLIRYLFLP